MSDWLIKYEVGNKGRPGAICETFWSDTRWKISTSNGDPDILLQELTNLQDQIALGDLWFKFKGVYKAHKMKNSCTKYARLNQTDL